MWLETIRICARMLTLPPRLLAQLHPGLPTTGQDPRGERGVGNNACDPGGTSLGRHRWGAPTCAPLTGPLPTSGYGER